MIGPDTRVLALVSLYSQLDTSLYKKSCWTVYSITRLEDSEGLHVIDAKSILSVISVQPHSHQLIPGEQHFFVWEQLGLDMALLQAEEDPGEDE
jgi:hypothetical protein